MFIRSVGPVLKGLHASCTPLQSLKEPSYTESSQDSNTESKNEYMHKQKGEQYTEEEDGVKQLTSASRRGDRKTSERRTESNTPND